MKFRIKLWIFDIKIEIQQPSHKLLCRDKRALPIALVDDDDDDDDSVGVKLAVVVDVVFEAGVTDRGQGERERGGESQSREI